MFSGTLNELDLLDRHLKMLKFTRENQPVGIIRISEMLELPKHKVRYSLRLLEQDGIIIATSDGAMVTDKYDQFLKELSEYLDELQKRIKQIQREIPKND